MKYNLNKETKFIYSMQYLLQYYIGDKLCTIFQGGAFG